MSCLTKSQEETVDRLYAAAGGTVPRALIAVFVRLSAPARTAISLQLLAQKEALQTQINSLTIRYLRAQVLSNKLSITYAAVSDKLNASKNTINLLGLGICATDDLDDPAIKKFVKTFTGADVANLTSMASFGGFDALNATANSVNYQLRRVLNAADASQNGLKILNSKISVIDSYLTILNAI